MASNRSSYLNLYSVEDLSDNAFKVRMENKQAKLAFSGSQEIEFDFGGTYKFKKADDSVFNLESRFDSLESDTGVATNAAAIASTQADLATESVARQSGDTANANNLSAEIAARVAAVQGVQNSVNAEAIAARANEQANADDIAQEISDRTAAVSSENARAQSAESALGVRIDNVISNSDPSTLDSLSELLADYQAADSSLGTLITNAVARIATLESQMQQLTQA